MKRLLTIAFVTMTYTSLVLAIIFANHASKTYCSAIELNIASGLITAKSNKLWDKKQPHTVVLLKPGKDGQWEIEDIKKFEDGQEEKFIKFLKRDK